MLSRVKIIPHVAIKWKWVGTAGTEHEVTTRRHRGVDEAISVLVARGDTKNNVYSARVLL